MGEFLSSLPPGPLAVVAALIGVGGALYIRRLNALHAAADRFRCAFAPALAIIAKARSDSPHNPPDVDAFIKNALLGHGSAVEEFRPFVRPSDRVAYQEAWESYRQTASQCQFSTAGEEWGANLQPGELLEQKIHAILQFAKT